MRLLGTSEHFSIEFLFQGKDGSSLEDRLNMWRGRWDKSMIGWHKSVVNEHLTKYYDYLLVNMVFFIENMKKSKCLHFFFDIEWQGQDQNLVSLEWKKYRLGALL